MAHQDNEPGKTYDVDDRRRAAALAACDGIPTEALERGIIKELYTIAGFLVVTDAMGERRDGYVLIPEHMWAADIRARINLMNDAVEPGHTARRSQ